MGEVAEQLPDDVVACVRSRVGEEGYSQSLNTSFSATDTVASIILSCFSSTEEEVAWFAVVLFSDTSIRDWGLSPEIRYCLQRVAATNAFVLGGFIGVHTESPTPEEYIAGTLGMILCMTDEEASLFFSDTDTSAGFHSPSELRCMETELGNLDALETLYIWREPGAEAIVRVVIAARQCGIEHGPWALSAETRMCVRPIWEATSGLSVSELPPTPETLVRAALESVLCHTDEEAKAVQASSDTRGSGVLLPSKLSCMKQSLGTFDPFVSLMLGEEQSVETSERLSRIADMCGADLAALRQ